MLRVDLENTINIHLRRSVYSFRSSMDRFVKRVVDKKSSRRKTEYLVQVRSCAAIVRRCLVCRRDVLTLCTLQWDKPDSQDSWEPLSALQGTVECVAPRILLAFWNRVR
jgi:hypothetical protein